jgi:nucleoside 2-deoxyribosyltransferase
MIIYIASRFRNKPLVREAGKRLEKAGIETLHTWTEEVEGYAPEDAADRDLLEIEQSDGILVLTDDCEMVPGGMHFEAGYALGRKKQVHLVGPKVNIFYHLDKIHTHASLDAFVYFIKKQSRYFIKKQSR